jgi:S1/P1 Nuclease
MRIDRYLQMLLVGWPLWASVSTQAVAWSRPGHIVTAAIAYDELSARDPKVIEQIIEIMNHHPERGPFEVAIGRATDAERVRRIFLEIARWPDDVRGGAQDHPSWHAAVRPLADTEDPPPRQPPNIVEFEAYEALPLNVHVVADADTHIPVSERAVALCWIFHIVGDMHQPLHATQLYSSQFPDGDHGGATEFVLDLTTHRPVVLHWFWDDLVSQTDEPDAAMARAHELETRYPRAQFAQELGKDRSLSTATDDVTTNVAANVKAWSDESYAVAKSIAYGPNRPRATDPADAKAADDNYVQASRRSWPVATSRRALNSAMSTTRSTLAMPLQPPAQEQRASPDSNPARPSTTDAPLPQGTLTSKCCRFVG